VKSNFKVVLFDNDGVLKYQGKVYEGAIELIEYLKEKGVIIRVITNSTLKNRGSCAKQLNEMGFNIDKEEVITASYATACYLRRLKPRSCWVMVKGEGLEEFKDINHQDMENPEYLVLGDLRDDFNFKTMNKAVKLLIRGSKLIVMITEMIDNSMGEIELTVGAYGKMLELASGTKATYIGKPYRYIFETALKSIPENIDKEKILMVGDKVKTDIIGAKNFGIKSALVKSGEFNENDLKDGVSPDYIFEKISEIKLLFN